MIRMESVAISIDPSQRSNVYESCRGHSRGRGRRRCRGGMNVCQKTNSSFVEVESDPNMGSPGVRSPSFIDRSAGTSPP